MQNNPTNTTQVSRIFAQTAETGCHSTYYGDWSVHSQFADKTLAKTGNSMSHENTLTAPPSQERIDANRRNAKKSTGPRTSEGKARSRFNGLKHGLTTNVAVLPGEDPAEYDARVAAVVGSYAPQNRVEFDLLERVAATTWLLERASRAEAAQISHKIRRHAIEREEREQEEAVALGQRLLWDARGPWQIYPHHPHTGLNWERRTSWSENPDDPNNPALLVLRLERTVAGCRLLLDRWAELKARLEPGEVWAASDQFKSVRLLGKQPLDAIDDPEVTQIFLASAKLLPDGPRANPFAAVKGELHRSGLGDGQDDRGVYSKELKKRSLTKLTPRDAEAAHDVLRALVDRRTARLSLILARNLEFAEADLAEAPARLAFDPSPDAERLRRYAGSAARLINQTLNTFVKIRKELATESDDSAESSAVSAPLSVDELSAHPDTPDSHIERTPGDPAPDDTEGSFGGLRTEPIAESSVVRGPLSVALESSEVSGPLSVAAEDSSGEAQSGEGLCAYDQTHELTDAPQDHLRTEAKTDLMAGQEFRKSAQILRDGAMASPHPLKGWRQGDRIPDLTEGCWKDFTEKLLARAAAAERALAGAAYAPRNRKKQAKARTRKARRTDRTDA